MREGQRRRQKRRLAAARSETHGARARGGSHGRARYGKWRKDLSISKELHNR